MHRLGFVLVAVIAVLAVAGCADATQPALEVNGVEFSRGDVHDAMAATAIESDFGDVARAGAAGASNSMNALIHNAIIAQELERLGESVTDDDLAEAVPFTEQTIAASQNTDPLPAASFDFVNEFIAHEVALARVVENPGEVYERIRTEAVVVIDPRYGRWEAGFYIPPAADLLRATTGL